jgi:CRISPR-associated exonuclease Cas4
MYDATLEVTDLKQWRYCSRVVWYRFCLPDIRPVTALMEQGIASHHDESNREERRSLRPYALTEGERFFDVPLRSERLGLRGRLDLAIAVPKRAAPGAHAVVVEYKDSEQQPGPHFKLQLAAYALLLEEAWGLSVTKGFVYLIPLRQAVPVSITAALRRKVTQTVSDIHTAIGGEALPPAPAKRRQCFGCEFRRFCNDVV